MRLLVIGGVAAGLSAASRARRLDASIEILVLEQGDTIAYGACGLPYYVGGRVERPEQLIVYDPEYFRKERNITVRTGARVAAISHARREVELSSGEKLHYDRLVVAAGARPDASEISGADLPHVFRLHTLQDGIRLRAHVQECRPRRAVVVGGGYIGLEVADALRRSGLSIVILEQSAYVLQREDADLTAQVRDHLERFGVELRCARRAIAIEPDRADDVRCDLAILAAGVRPNVEVAAEHGVALGRAGAIQVDDRTETNLAGVYAAGDCAEAHHTVWTGPCIFPSELLPTKWEGWQAPMQRDGANDSPEWPAPPLWRCSG